MEEELREKQIKLSMAEKQALDVMISYEANLNAPENLIRYKELAKKFYNLNLEIEKEVLKEMPKDDAKGKIQEQKTPSEKKNNQIGALWLSKDFKVLKGNCYNEKITIPDEITAKLKSLAEGQPFTFQILNKTIVAFKNKFKKSPTQPDFVLLNKVG